MFKSIFLPIIAVAAFIIFVGLLSQGKLDKYTSDIRNSSNSELKSIKINDVSINVEVAKTSDEKSKGLSNRNSLDRLSGMVFVFARDSKPTFWMKDTKIPLDLVWINENKVIGINKNVLPEPGVNDSKLKRYPAPGEVNYVLELNGGFCDEFGIKVGQSLSGLEQL